MTDNDRAPLVEEISAILQGCVIVANMDDDAPPTTISEGTLNNMAYSLLPIIERLLAANDLDAAIDGSRVIQTLVMDGADGGYEADIAVGRGPDSVGGYDKYRATGKTFTEAIRNAVAKAKGERHE